MNEFPVKGNQYKPMKMPAKIQFHVTRRLTPFIVGMIGKLPKEAIAAAMTEDKKNIDLNAIVSQVNPMDMLTPVLESLAVMPDKEVDYVLDTCMEYCQRSLGADRGWATVKQPGSPCQYSDIDMIAMLQIVWFVIQGNIGNFFPVPSLNTTEQTQTA
jgi:hypothetical protein